MPEEITSVLVDPYALAPASVRYPNGHICDIAREQSPLMNAAADLLAIQIHYDSATRPDLRSVYVKDFAIDPALLLDLFETLKLCVWKWRRNHETITNPADPSASNATP